VQIVILCEDDQQENLARAYLKSRGRRPFRVVKSPDGSGSAEQFVIQRFPGELEARRRDTVNRSLAVFLDADSAGVARRHSQLDQACDAQNVDRRTPDDRVGVFVPARNIETWLRYLEGQQVTEQRDYSPPGPHRPIACREHIRRLDQWCATGNLPANAPAQLSLACQEVARVL